MAHPARWLLVGLGKTGLSCARFLTARGEAYALTDSRANPPALAAILAFAPDAPCYCGSFDLAALTGISTVVVSPGVSLQEPLIQAAQARGLSVIGDIELFAQQVQAPVVAITGANGKSTVTTLLGLIAAQAGLRVQVGGNLGTPALDLLDPTAALYVLELSSFQLDTTTTLRPTAAVVLNISPDHLDRHGSLANYVAAKAKVYAHAVTSVFNADDPAVAALAGESTTALWFSLSPPQHERVYGVAPHEGQAWLCRGATPLLPVAAVKLAGRHNLANVLAAWALADALALPQAAICAAVATFSGLPHRTEWVAAQAGVTWYNDSKGTNIGATLAALQGMTCPVVLIAGGQGKGADFSLLRSTVAAKARAVVLLGEDAPLLAAALADTVPLVRVTDMRAAVAQAQALALAGDCVLLSPACASFDMFRGYEHRGQHYRDCVRERLGVSP